MNLQEFAALKVGDCIENPMNDAAGEVVAIDAKGVRVRWSHSGLEHTRHYTAQTTAWFHWSLAC